MKLTPMASALISTSPGPGGGLRLVDVGQDFGSAGFGDFNGVHGDYHAKVMKLARPDIVHPRIVLAGCPALPRATATTTGLVAALRTARPARPLAVLGRPGDPGRRPGDPARDVGLHRPARRVPGLDARGCANLLNAPGGGGVEHRQALSRRPRRRRGADACRALLRAGRAVRLPAGEVVVKPAVGAGSVGAQRFTDADAAREHAAALQGAGRRCWCSPTTRGWRTARRRWCSSAASSRTRSPRGRCCRRRGSAGVRPVGHLRRGDADARPTPTSSCGTSATRRWPRRPPTWASRRPTSSTPASTSSADRDDPHAAGAGTGGAVTGLAAARRRPRGTCSSASSRSASSQPSSGSGSVRSRIDAHSAAVAAVHAAAPATWTRHQRGGHAGEELHGADETLRAHQRHQHAEPQRTGRGACTASSPKPSADQQRQVGHQQRRVQVHQRGDLDLQPRHRSRRCSCRRRAARRR